MIIIVHLPDDEEMKMTVHNKPQLGKSINRCYNPHLLHCPQNCNKCLRDLVVEMTEAGSEIWVEFSERKR